MSGTGVDVTRLNRWTSSLECAHKVEPHLSNGFLNHVLVHEFNKFTLSSMGKPFERGQFPRDFEDNDWSAGHCGPEPPFWRYVKKGACHWLVNFNLWLAQLVEPDRHWRIITSDRHSTVWDGRDTLFDFNFLALGVPADECFELAHGNELRPGQFLDVGLPAPEERPSLGTILLWEEKL